jgi:23S rRNA pseudouridine1911/1915/1917 synthase
MSEEIEGSGTAYRVGSDEVETRLDRFLVAATAGGFSRNRLKQLIEEGAVAVDGVVVTEAAYALKQGQRVALTPPRPRPAEPAPEAIPLVVVYEDDALIVIDKPAGLVVHPAAGNMTGTLVNALIAHCGQSLSGIGGVKRPGIVHRLDKDTSGLMVIAKTDAAHRGLAEQFADHGRSGPLERAYAAFVWGVPRPRQTIETGIERSRRNREKMAAVAVGRGRWSATHVTLVEAYRGEDGDPIASLVDCRLETGRTHQIRVHLGHIGHPLLGDDVYGSGFRTKAQRLAPAARAALDALGRQALHARLLGFVHPISGHALRFESRLPPELEKLSEALKLS